MVERGSRIVRFLREARRRKVLVSGGAYIVLSITVMELSDRIFHAIQLPDWTVRFVTIVLVLGFPFVVVFAWIFDVTAGGLVRTGAAQAGASGTSGRDEASTFPEATKGGSSARPVVRSVSKAPSRAPAGAATATTPAPTEVPEADPPRSAPDPARVRKAAIAHVRHELRTPINAIIGYGEMLLEDEAEDGPLAGDLANVRDAGRKLLSLVDEILRPDRAASGEQEIEALSARIRADLRNPINAVVGYTEMLVEEAEEEGREHVVPDLERILEAAHRLLEMSTDIVQVATGAAATGTTERISEASALTEEVLSKIRPVEAAAESADQQGTLLVVDDNAFNRDLLSRQLARQGYLVATAENGREALEMLEARDFDLVLLDIIMPEMDGLEALRRIKGSEATREIPVIMLSSLDEVDSAIRCVELGAEDYLSKPFHPTLLQARIGANLEIRRIREQERAFRARAEEEERLMERLLRASFPPSIAERVRTGESEFVESFAEATVLWCDLEAASRTGPRQDPADVALRMERLLEAFDEGAAEHGLETVSAQGSYLVAAGGLPVPCEDHAERVARVALTAMAVAREGSNGVPPPLRMGIHSGSVTGGVLGGERIGYRLWGDAVELARSLEAHAPPGTIHVSPATYGLLKERFAFQSLGVREVAGRGQMRTYRLEGAAAEG